jgi:carboxyl-terminal processing protease
METQHRESVEDKKESAASSTPWLAGIALAIVAFAGGYLVRDLTPPSADTMPAGLFAWFKDVTAGEVEEVNLKEFWRVWKLMDEKFVGATSTPLTNEEKINGAIKGLVDSYDDPYSLYLTPKEAAEFGETISGNFGGVGMEVGVRNGLLTVIAPLADTPAEAAGILAGDAIISIDGRSTERMSTDEAVSLIRGEKGTTVTLSLYREGETDFLEKNVVRDIITMPTINTEVKGDTFVLSIHSFNALVEAKMAEAMNEFYASGLEKLVIDVRGNPGGYLESAVNMTGYFLPAGKVVVREDFGDGLPEEVYRSSGAYLNERTPKHVVILMDGGSASASEIFAGALKEHGVATLVGTDTFGKGSVQELVALPNKASLKVTIAQWLTPEGRSISEGGLSPDVEVEITAEQILSGNDVQLEKAIEVAGQ